MKELMKILAGLALAATLPASTLLQDWSNPKHYGTYADKQGSQLEAEACEGPEPGQTAVLLKGKLVGWAGAWCLAKASLPAKGAVRLMAQSSQPCTLQVGLKSGNKWMVASTARLQGKAWQELVLPLSAFKGVNWTDPEAVAGGAFDPKDVEVATLQPLCAGPVEIKVSGLSLLSGERAAKDGRPAVKGGFVVQDFWNLEASAYGVFKDDKTGTGLEVQIGAFEGAEQAAKLQASIKPKGWAGMWVRTGEDWNRQDWSGVKALVFKVKAARPLVLQVGFNDAKQNAYLVEDLAVKPGDWQSLRVPISAFKLNPYYQPDQAKAGAALDLSAIEAVNIAPVSQGDYELLVDEVRAER